MPRIVRQGGSMPDWCQLKQFSIHTIGKAETRLEPASPKERLVSTGGSVQMSFGSGSQVVGTGQFVDFRPEDGPVSVVAVGDSGQIVRLSGDWGDELGGCGVFTAQDTDSPSDGGDPVTYDKTTNVDRHYHDCDEYWILLEGQATAVVGNSAGEMNPGDCLCIGMGWHHDMAHAPKPVKAVYFETTLERGKRTGHLWEHTHGPAVPAAERG